MLQVILDNSSIIAYLISKNDNYMKDIIEFARNKSILLISTEVIFKELQVAITKKEVKRRKNYNEKTIGQFIAWYKYNSVNIDPYLQSKETSRDHKDNIFLDLAETTKVNFLITVDKDLLILKKTGVTKILRPKEFMQKYTEKYSSRR